MATKTLIYEHEKDTKRYAKFEPARGERAVGGIYLDLDEDVVAEALAKGGRIVVTITTEAA